MKQSLLCKNREHAFFTILPHVCVGMFAGLLAFLRHVYAGATIHLPLHFLRTTQVLTFTPVGV